MRWGPACKVPVDPRLGLRRVPHHVRLHGEGEFALQMARGVGNDTETFSCESGRRGAWYVLCGRGGGGILLQCAHTSVTCRVPSHYSPWGIVTSSIFVAVRGSSVLNNWNGSRLVAKISLRYGRINMCQFSSGLSPSPDTMRWCRNIPWPSTGKAPTCTPSSP